MLTDAEKKVIAKAVKAYKTNYIYSWFQDCDLRESGIASARLLTDPEAKQHG